MEKNIRQEIDGFSDNSISICTCKYLQKYLTYEASFFFQNIGTLLQIFKKEIKCCKKFLVFKIIWFQLVLVNSLYYNENTCSWQSTFYQADVKSQIWLKITFSNSIWLKWRKSRTKILFGRFQEFLRLVNTFTAKDFQKQALLCN